MPDRTRGAAHVTPFDRGFQALAASLAARRARPATTPTGPTSLAPVAPRRLITDPTTFFGPGMPMPPHAPGAAGRRFDYPFAYNTMARPRSTELTPFAKLRALADAHDLTRIAIETRKDQLARADWVIARKDGADGDAPPAIAAFLERPDRDNDWPTWVGMLLEEVFVPDATSIYLRRTRGGGLYAAELLDGTTIVPLLDETGRAPLPPDPAYQQILKGMPAVDYSRDELLYLPRTKRVHKIYGYSPVEQIYVTIELALRRQAHQLRYYDASNIPPALVAVPKEWTAPQIEAFQLYWDQVTSGAENADARSQMRFVPGDVKAQLLQTAPLFDEFAEEWLARIVCYAFSLPPTAFTRQTNRATAETVQDAAEDEGLAPLMRWVKGVVDRLIQAPEGLGYTDWAFQWKLDRPLEPATQATIDVQYLTAGVRTPEAVALERFGTYTKPEPPPAPVAPPADAPPATAPSATAPSATAPSDGEAAKAAGRSLRRDARWY